MKKRRKQIKKQVLFKTLIIFFIISFFILNAFTLKAQTEEFNLNTKKIEALINISNKIQSDASRVIVNLTLFPKQLDKQQVIIATEPEASINEDFILFNFSEKGSLEFVVKTQVKNEFLFKRIEKGVDLPFAVPSELSQYINNSEYITIDPYIKNKAHQLIAKNKDALETLYNIAEYVRKNMNYSTEFQELKNASWIMENKQGVCSHYAILFIALARSIGIPARFVSGLAYSNKDKTLREHAWAEVWLPDQGWIPYDTTFGQYGWLDSSHIVMKKTVDAGSAAVEYYYIGNIEIDNLSIKSSINKVDNLIDSFSLPIELEISPYFESVGFNSYVPIEVTIKNLNNYYIYLPVRITIAPGVFGESEKIVFLKPNSETKTFFIINIPELRECKKDCIATIALADIFNNSAQTTILIKTDQERISLQKAQELIYYKSPITSAIDFYCKTDKEFYYDYENISVDCKIKAQEDIEVSVCSQEICKNLSLSKNQLEEIELNLQANKSKQDSLQMQCLILCIITKEEKPRKETLAISCVDMTLLKTPELKINSIENNEASYGSKETTNLIIESNSDIVAFLTIDTKKYEETKKVFLEKGTNVVPIEIKTWKLDIGENPIQVKLDYQDKNNKGYESEKNFTFIVKDTNIFKKLIIKIIHLFD